MDSIAVKCEMLRYYHEGVDKYQPTADDCELEPETGDTAVSVRNVKKLLEGDRVLRQIAVKKDKAMFFFHTAEMLTTLGLGLGDPERLDALTRIASDEGWGDYDRLRHFYGAFPNDYDGLLPPVIEAGRAGPATF
jgi:hypothetical protein